MRKLFMIISGSMLVVWSAASALGGCGGDEGGAAIAQNDASAAETSSGSSSGTSGSSGSSSGTSGSTDAGARDAAPDGSSSSGVTNPGKVTCGGSECTADTQFCCRSASDAGCVAKGGNCQGAEVECDEAADCKNKGEVCCLTAGAAGLRARCGADCNDFNQIQVCKTAAECGDAGACAQKTCYGQKVQMCGSKQGCN